jgi:hypothetical protein
MADLFTLAPIPPPPHSRHSTEAKFLDPDWGDKVESLLKFIYKNLTNFKQHTLIILCVKPQSSMVIVGFIPQSGTMNLATATNVVFHYFLYFSSPFANFAKGNKAFSEPRNTFLGCVYAKPYQNV